MAHGRVPRKDKKTTFGSWAFGNGGRPEDRKPLYVPHNQRRNEKPLYQQLFGRRTPKRSNDVKTELLGKPHNPKNGTLLPPHAYGRKCNCPQCKRGNC